MLFGLGDGRTALPTSMVSTVAVIGEDGRECGKAMVQHFICGGEQFPFVPYKVVDGRFVGVDLDGPVLRPAARSTGDTGAVSCVGESSHLGPARQDGALPRPLRMQSIYLAARIALVTATVVLSFVCIRSLLRRFASGG